MKCFAKDELTLINTEENVSSKIPYACCIDDETIETKSGHLLQILKLDGLYSETLDDQDIDYEKKVRNFLYMGMSDSTISLYFHTIRKKIDLSPSEKKSEASFCQELSAEYMEKMSNKRLFINEYYLTVVKKPPIGKIRNLQDVFTKIWLKADLKEKDLYRSKSHADLNKLTSRIQKQFGHYGIKKLGAENGFSGVTRFLGNLINLQDRKIRLADIDLSRYLPSKRIFFDKKSGTIVHRDINNSFDYSSILAIKTYAGHTAAGFLDSLQDLQLEFIIAQSFSFLDKENARSKMREQIRNEVQSDDGETSESNKIFGALDDLGSNVASNGMHHFSILIHAKSQSQLEENITIVEAALTNIGIAAIREDRGIEASYFAMLPANHAYIARNATISTKNMASFASFHNAALGKKSGNYWGGYVTVLETLSGSPYYFNFHVQDVGNTFLVGPQGTGKTALEAFLVSESMKFGGRTICFDKDRGLEIFIRAQGGHYSALSSEERSGFSPFQLEDTSENRHFLIKLLRKIASSKSMKLTDYEDLALQKAVDIAFSLPKKDRVLRHITQALGAKKEGSLRMRFEAWTNEGEYAWIFDNEKDDFELSGDCVGRDMTKILSDPIAAGPIYFYLFHRIEQTCSGIRTRIILAEGWRALQDEIFREQIRDWSSTPRKKEMFLIIDTQSPQDISSSEIGCKIIQESPTQFYFANPKAAYEDYVGKFKLTVKEFEIIKSLDRTSHFFLLKQGKCSVIARADLSGMDRAMSVLSGRSKYTKILDRLRKEYGNHPSQWLQRYYKEIEQESGLR